MILRNTHRLLQEIEALKQENLKLSSAVEKASALNTELIQKNADFNDECAELRSKLSSAKNEINMLRARLSFSNTTQTVHYANYNTIDSGTGTDAKKPCEFAWQMPYKIRETKK